MRYSAITSFILIFSFSCISQVGIGTITPSPRSVLEISSSSNGGASYGGFLPPRVSTIVQRNMISPGFSDVGMLIFVEAIGCLQLWDGDSWENITCVTVATPEIWINEIHYDNIGTDTGEGFEIAGVAGTDLNDYQMVRYSGNGAGFATTTGVPINLTGFIPNEGTGFGTLATLLPANGLQNDDEGLALVKISTGNVIQFLSYEDSLIATNGPAMGMVSENIGVSESNTTTPVGTSLQLVGTGNEYVDFTWTTGSVASFGATNTGQVIN
ncbi:hypothetical protein [Rasiella sp. SM2506]|uniref:hypothetical protein n=1 Tax=Rasiella sp. SM2506 TaxID=3423914 RepID=UPI003D79A9BF